MPKKDTGPRAPLHAHAHFLFQWSVGPCASMQSTTRCQRGSCPRSADIASSCAFLRTPALNRSFGPGFSKALPLPPHLTVVPVPLEPSGPRSVEDNWRFRSFREVYSLTPYDNAAPACPQRALTPARSYSGLTPVLLRGRLRRRKWAARLRRALPYSRIPNPPPADSDSESESGPYSRILPQGAG